MLPECKYKKAQVGMAKVEGGEDEGGTEGRRGAVSDNFKKCGCQDVGLQ